MAACCAPSSWNRPLKLVLFVPTWLFLFVAAITAIKGNIRWWDVLTNVEQGSGASIDALVGDGESVINAEWAAGKSTALRVGKAKMGTHDESNDAAAAGTTRPGLRSRATSKASQV